MLANLQKTRGETLIEVLVAIVILVVGVLAALRVISLASVQNSLTAQNVQAVNLAREGLEAVREIRDTNWLRFAGERRDCWSALNNDCQISDDRNSIKKGNYSIGFTSDYKWEMTQFIGKELNLNDGGLDADFRLKLENGLYNDDAHAAGKDTVFFRQIKWEYLNTDGTTSDTTTDSARVTAKVEWYDHGRIKNVTLSTVLTDYWGRTSSTD